MLGSSPRPRSPVGPRALAAAAGRYAIVAVIATWAAALSTPVIGSLLDPGSATQESRRRDRAEGRAFFAKWKIDVVVVHPSPVGRTLKAIVEDALAIQRRERFADGSELLWVNGP